MILYNLSCTESNSHYDQYFHPLILGVKQISFYFSSYPLIVGEKEISLLFFILPHECWGKAKIILFVSYYSTVGVK